MQTPIDPTFSSTYNKGAPASKAGASSGKGANSIDGDIHLPMIVWLKGDEDFFEEFVVEAEAAMNLLGIKRTRLTQISGRELRVGRVRSGRYIKPVYRQADLEDYLLLARAPLTYKKTSTAVEELNQSLLSQARQQFEQINSIAAEQMSRQLDLLMQELGATLQQKLAAEMRLLLQQLQLGFQHEQVRAADSVHLLQKQMHTIMRKADSHDEKLAKNGQQLDKVYTAVAENFRGLQEMVVQLAVVQEQMQNLASNILSLQKQIESDRQPVKPSSLVGSRSKKSLVANKLAIESAPQKQKISHLRPRSLARRNFHPG